MLDTIGSRLRPVEHFFQPEGLELLMAWQDARRES
jgi:hypothetical protein